ncbi:hypothetical protein E8E11_010600 [Didymella keratinophila]|nr:hypothetical protein E8E11_010600 [Didymella keratinophila]
MSVSPSVAYNLQNHGTDYNLVTNGSSPSAGSSRVYAWQATSCGTAGSSYLVDTLTQKCLWGSGSSVAVHDCTSSDQAWSIRGAEDSVDTFTIQNVNGDSNNGFLSLYEDRLFNLSDGSSSYSRWSFQSESPPTNVTWDVCAHISGDSSSSTTISSATSAQAVIVTASSALSASGGSPVSSGAASTSSPTSTLTEEQFSAEATAAATSQTSNVMASGASTPTGTTPTPSGSDAPQSNDAGAMKVAWGILVTALMVGTSVASS